jgi:tetratricopeptide (TPR) repeat protein
MLREARILRLDGKNEESLAKLRLAEEAFPHSILPVMALWDYHQRHGLPEAEERQLRELLIRRLADPESPLPPGTLHYLVEMAEATEDYLELLLRAVESRTAESEPEPRYLEAMAVLYERLGRLPQARELLGKLMELRPSVELRQHCLSLDYRLERWPEVADGFKQLLEEDPFFLHRMNYIEVLAKLGRYEEVVRQLDLLEESSDVGPEQFQGGLRDLLLQVAWDLRDAGADEGAESIFRRLLEIDPDNAEARNAILHLYSTHEERLAHRQALEQRWDAETDAETLSRRGANLLAGGDAAGAFDLLQRAAEGMPGSEMTWFNLGLAAGRLERWEEAERAMERAITLNPARADGYLHRGAALQRLERCPEAIPLLNRALSLDGNLMQAHYYLYFCYHAVGDYEASGEHRKLYEKSTKSAGQ